jgi:hypothetical protein
MAEEKKRKKEKMSPEEWEQQQQQNLERKLKLAQRDDMGIVSRKTLDSTDFIRLFGTADFMLSLVRGNMGRKGKIELTKAARFLAEAERIKEELNLLNADMCRELGRDYKPPYGFENPLKEEKREEHNQQT